MEELCSLLLSEAIHEESGHKTRSTTELNVAFSSVRGGYSNQGQRNNFSSNNRGFRDNQRSGYRGGNFSQNRGNSGGNSGHYRGGYSRGGGRTSGYPQRDYSQHSHGYGGYSQNTSHKSSGLFCQICNKPNHSAFECRHRLNMDYQPQPYYSASSSSQIGQFTPGSSQNKAYIASVPEPPNSNWYVDFAASTHITNDLSSLSLYEPYHGQGPQEGAFLGPAY
ncbi:hypothetical protein Vadar_019946 [Vaccinium darrowii]|uniref:Uncharacterized protein n=1 Tax=Vaccinium darrowii TaxID=229202 RepID=A0ACB7XIR2_9ERIC|nr:hypothetical protein Vadar_019946 [Vaccinium darrowii]